MVDAPILINTCSELFAVVVFLQRFGNIYVSEKLPHVYARFVLWTWITQLLSNSKDTSEQRKLAYYGRKKTQQSTDKSQFL